MTPVVSLSTGPGLSHRPGAALTDAGAVRVTVHLKRDPELVGSADWNTDSNPGPSRTQR